VLRGEAGFVANEPGRVPFNGGTRRNVALKKARLGEERVKSEEPSEGAAAEDAVAWVDTIGALDEGNDLALDGAQKRVGMARIAVGDGDGDSRSRRG
jgi:hypothetical protein